MISKSRKSELAIALFRNQRKAVITFFCATCFLFTADGLWAQQQDVSSIEPNSPDSSGGEVASGDEELTPDIFTNLRVEDLLRDGLIERQAALSEGLLLMDRQLRQMQLVEQILAAYGPDAAVEVAPGEFLSFRGTPAGMRQEIAFIDLQMQLAEKRNELSALQNQKDESAQFDVPRSTVVFSDGTDRQSWAEGEQTAGSVGLNRASPGEMTPEGGEAVESSLTNLVLEEVYGEIGDLSAVVTLDGVRQTVKAEDVLYTGQRVTSVERDKLFIQLTGGDIREFRIR